MNSLLDLYRTGELHLPKNLCGNTVERELKFWEIPPDLIKECCFKTFEEHKDDAHITREIDNFLTMPYETAAEIETLSTWHKIWLIMERPKLCRASKIWSCIFFTIVILSVLLYCLETTMFFRAFSPWFYVYVASLNATADMIVPSLDLKERYGITSAKPWLRHFQEAVFVFFVVEFFVRLITCPKKKYFAKQAKNWLDLFLLLQNGLTIFLETVVLNIKPLFNWSGTESDALIFFYSLSVMRVLRIFYLAKSFDTMKILLLSTKASLKVLVLLAICVLSLATMFGASVFLAEILTDMFTFTSIPYAMWYAIVTMTTVGYGDVVPVSTPGRVLGMLCALCGVIVMALPIAVIASKFTSYHDNISARQQMQNRLGFLRNHPGFCTKKNESDAPPTGKHEQEKSTKNSDLKSMKNCEDQPKDEGSSCFRLCPSKRKQRKVRSHPVLVSGYKPSTQAGLNEMPGEAVSDIPSPGLVEDISDVKDNDVSSQHEFVNKY